MQLQEGIPLTASAGLRNEGGASADCWEADGHPFQSSPFHDVSVQASARGMGFPQAGPASPSAAQVSAPQKRTLNPQQQVQPQRDAGGASAPKSKNGRKAKKQSAKRPATTQNTSVVQLAELLTTGSQYVQPTVPNGTGRPQRGAAAGCQTRAAPESKQFGKDDPKEILPSRIPVLGLCTLAEAGETNFGLLSKHERQLSDVAPVRSGSEDPLNDLARLCASLAEAQSSAVPWASTSPTATHWAYQARTPSSATSSMASPERSVIGWARTPSPTASPARSPQRARSPTVGSCQRVSSPAYVDPVGMVLFNELQENLCEVPPRSPDMRWARTPSTVFSPSVSPHRRELDIPGARMPTRGLPSVDVHRLNDIFEASTQPQPLLG